MMFGGVIGYMNLITLEFFLDGNCNSSKEVELQ